MNYNPRPQDAYRSNSQLTKNHHALVEQEPLRIAIDTALLEYQRKQTEMAAPDLGGCAACFLRIQGAQEFVGLLLNLAETPTSTPIADNLNLPGNVRQMPKR